MKTPKKKKVNRRLRPEKPTKTTRGAERTMKHKSLADFIDSQKEPDVHEPETFAQADLVCPFCKFRHDPSDLRLNKEHTGLVKCGDCGEAFEFEMAVQKTYTTFAP